MRLAWRASKSASDYTDTHPLADFRSPYHNPFIHKDTGEHAVDLITVRTQDRLRVNVIPFSYLHNPEIFTEHDAEDVDWYRHLYPPACNLTFGISLFKNRNSLKKVPLPYHHQFDLSTLENRESQASCLSVVWEGDHAFICVTRVISIEALLDILRQIRPSLSKNRYDRN
jgi:hypothetical protein